MTDTTSVINSPTDYTASRLCKAGFAVSATTKMCVALDTSAGTVGGTACSKTNPCPAGS